MSVTIKKLLVALCALTLFCSVAAANGIEMNLDNMEIPDVVKLISKLTGKNFILDDNVIGNKGTVTVISPTPLTLDEAYEVFQAILSSKGLTIVESGKLLKIVPQQTAKQTNIETVLGPADPGDRFVTRLVPLKFIQATAAEAIIKPLGSAHAYIKSYEPTNTLIIADANSNIERLLGIIEQIDMESEGAEMRIYHLAHAAADTIAATLQQAVVGQGAPTSRRRIAPGAKGGVSGTSSGGDVQVRIIPDSRTNSLIVVADEASMAQVDKLVKVLDVEIPSGTGKINVYQLKYADADNIASVLTTISKAAGIKAKPGKPGAVQRQVVKSPGSTNTSMPVNFENAVNITADKTTNSLVIMAVPQDFQTLKEVIEKLDVRRPQVLIEAMIIEMSYDKAVEMGVEWRTTTDPTKGGFNVVGGSGFGQMAALGGLATNPFATPSGMFLAAIDGTIEVGGITYPNLGAVITALQTQGDLEVIATPHLLTTDNEEAEIIVSDNIPFQTSEKFDSNGQPIFTFEYRDVGLTLRFTPQINDENFVKLKLFQEVSDVVSVATGGSKNAPSTTKRSAKTTVVVKDASTVVIGGLIQEGKEITTNSVPCLGDIPILGLLFKSERKAGEKTNLMIFLTPHIIRDYGDLEKLTQEKRAQYDRDILEKHRLTGQLTAEEEATLEREAEKTSDESADTPAAGK